MSTPAVNGRDGLPRGETTPPQYFLASLAFPHEAGLDLKPTETFLMSLVFDLSLIVGPANREDEV